jgi:hypothetical protein
VLITYLWIFINKEIGFSKLCAPKSHGVLLILKLQNAIDIFSKGCVAVFYWVWRPKADERVSHPPWRALSFLHPEEEMQVLIDPPQG